MSELQTVKDQEEVREIATRLAAMRTIKRPAAMTGKIGHNGTYLDERTAAYGRLVCVVRKGRPHSQPIGWLNGIGVAEDQAYIDDTTDVGVNPHAH